MHHAVAWYAVVQALGLLATPLAFRLFSSLPDRGYSTTKPIGLLLVCYGAWILPAIGIVPHGLPLLLAMAALLGCAGVALGWRLRREMLAFVREAWPGLLATEAVFAGLFALWVFVIAHSPAIDHTEKPMDFAFMNAVLRARWFPPEDPWLAGHPVSYYYFGHLMAASLARLSFTPSPHAYNLAVALVPALTGTVAYGLVFNLVRASGARLQNAVTSALAAPLLVGLIANLEGALEFVRAQGWGSAAFWQWVSIEGLNAGEASGGVYPSQTWWWWRSTRVINTIVDGRSLDYTITEFPFFSFLLGDLHAHVSSLPFVLLNLSVGLNLLLSPERIGPRWVCDHPWQFLFAVVSLGSLGFLNTWDLPVMAALLGLVLLAKAVWQCEGKLGRGAVNTLLFLVPLVAAAVAFYLPFYRSFSSQASGIAPVEDVATRPFHMLLVWGLLGFLGVSLLLRQAADAWRGRPGVGVAVWTACAALAPFGLWALVRALMGAWDGELASGMLAVGNRFARVLPFAVVAAAAFLSALAQFRQGNEAVAFSMVLVALAAYIIMGVELFYVQDVFGGRMNTVFKFYYEAWLLLAVAGAYALWFWFSRPAPRMLLPRLCEGMWVVVLAVLLAASLYLPPGAIFDKANDFKDPPDLDGLAYVRRYDEDEYKAILWLRDEAPAGRIVEAVGPPDWSEYGRVSESTGLPTILGWEGHEWQWRGTWELFANRRQEVAEIYQATDMQRAEELLDKYGVRYIYVGRRERASYGTMGLAKFEALPAPFRRGSVVIYERLP